MCINLNTNTKFEENDRDNLIITQLLISIAYLFIYLRHVSLFYMYHGQQIQRWAFYTFVPGFCRGVHLVDRFTLGREFV